MKGLICSNSVLKQPKAGNRLLNRQAETPLFSKLIAHIQNQPIPFHIPGHKQGKGADPEFYEFLGDPAFQMDLINIAPLDDLHHPHSIIKKAQTLAAEAFHADHTYFSVQGTSGSILTMILSVCSPGDKIIVPRNIHKSVLSALILADAIPIFLYPETDNNLGISHNITPKQIKQALSIHPDVKAIFVINPTYFGISGSLQEIVSIAHQVNIPVLVDEAHGALNVFHEGLPISAMDAGADMAATSLHKMGGSLTQSSFLHLQNKRIDPQRVQSVSGMLTTTSTSYLLMASLDAQRRFLAIHGHQAIESTLRLAHFAQEKINEIPGISCSSKQFFHYESVSEVDPCKLTIHLEYMGITGHEAEKWLRECHRIEVELSDLYNILCVITIGDCEESVQHLITALHHLSEQFYQRDKTLQQPNILIPDTPNLVMSPREAFYHQDVISVPLEQSVGKTIAESIMVYPPGIPVLLPGEQITQENVFYIREHLAADLPVQGTMDPNVQMIRVIR